ncbi:MAG: sialidase family protein [Planctomycetota bacterium]
MKSIATFLIVMLSFELFAADAPAAPGVVSFEFIYETAPFPSCHASTLVETKSGLVAAWFGGTREGAKDVCIWSSRHIDGKWTAPVEIASGAQSENTREPLWNPVLFQPTQGPLMFFYKMGPSPSTWWGMLKTSTDDGKTWSTGEKLPDGIFGPIKNKPIELKNGDILSGTSTETNGWRVHFELSPDAGKTWKKVEPTADTAGKNGGPINAIQPSILTLTDGRLLSIGRTKEGSLFRTFSLDNGNSWSPLALTQMPNPNSGTDAMTLKDGRHLLVYNHTLKGRSPLNVAISKDGLTWSAALVLESNSGEYSYPCVIQSSDGKVHIAYTWHRTHIKHVIIDPEKLELKPIENGVWPK